MRPAHRVQPILVEPAYGCARADGTPYRPTTREAFTEWFDAMNVFRHRTRLVPFVTGSFHIATGVATLLYFTWFLTVESIPSRVFSTVLGIGIGIVYHSVWWHRYCTHKAFTFRSLAWARVFAWTNPLGYRDETFVLPHRLHHRIADRPGDPYTPLVGWLVCYMSAETQQRVNRNVSREQYESVVAGLRHLGLKLNSYEAFQRTGSVEHVGSFFLHAIAAQVLWVVPIAALGGTLWVLGWYSAVFFNMFIARDFNYRGHAGDDHSAVPEDVGGGLALNHRLYGYMSGEWHNNHHAFPASARMGFLPGQPDAGFLFIRLLYALGIVATYNDRRDKFLERQLAAGDGAAARAGSAPAATA